MFLIIDTSKTGARYLLPRQDKTGPVQSRRITVSLSGGGTVSVTIRAFQQSASAVVLTNTGGSVGTLIAGLTLPPDASEVLFTRQAGTTQIMWSVEESLECGGWRAVFPELTG